MRRSDNRTLWYVLAALLGLYIVIAVARGGFGTIGSTLLGILISLLAIIIAITVHECSHAWAADKLGDSTARLMGRVTLNPLAHLDPMGTVMMILTALTGVGIGWGKPTPVNPTRLKYGSRVGYGVVALAGPISNLLVGTFFGLILRFAPLSSYYLYLSLYVFTLTNFYLCFFNLLPFPPLDGFSVLIGILALFRGRWAWQATNWLRSIEPYGSTFLFGAIILLQFLNLPVLSWVIGTPAYALYHLVTGL